MNTYATSFHQASQTMAVMGAELPQNFWLSQELLVEGRTLPTSMWAWMLRAEADLEPQLVAAYMGTARIFHIPEPRWLEKVPPMWAKRVSYAVMCAEDAARGNASMHEVGVKDHE